MTWDRPCLLISRGEIQVNPHSLGARLKTQSPQRSIRCGGFLRPLTIVIIVTRPGKAARTLSLSLGIAPPSQAARSLPSALFNALGSPAKCQSGSNPASSMTGATALLHGNITLRCPANISYTSLAGTTPTMRPPLDVVFHLHHQHLGKAIVYAA